MNQDRLYDIMIYDIHMMAGSKYKSFYKSIIKYNSWKYGRVIVNNNSSKMKMIKLKLDL